MMVIFQRKEVLRWLLLKAVHNCQFSLLRTFDLGGLASQKCHIWRRCGCVCLVLNSSPPDCVLFDFHHLLLNRYFKSPSLSQAPVPLKFRAIWKRQKARNGKKVESLFYHSQLEAKECVPIFSGALFFPLYVRRSESFIWKAPVLLPYISHRICRYFFDRKISLGIKTARAGQFFSFQFFSRSRRDIFSHSFCSPFVMNQDKHKKGFPKSSNTIAQRSETSIDFCVSIQWNLMIDISNNHFASLLTTFRALKIDLKIWFQ